MKRFWLILLLISMCATVALATAVRPKGDSRFQALSAQKKPLPSAELDAEINNLITYVNGMSLTASASEWFDPSLTATHINATQFSVSGDHTSEFVKYRRLKFQLGASFYYSEVVSSAYIGGSNITQVTIYDTFLTNPIAKVWYSIANSALGNGAISTNMLKDASGKLTTDIAGNVTGNLAGNVTGNVTGNLTGNVTSSGSNSLASLTVSGYANLPPPGAVIAFAMQTVPTGWLECNGSAVSRTTYSALFAAIGTTYGVGDGSTTFNLPDLRGEFVRGWTHTKTGTNDDGRAFGSVQADQNKTHNHGGATAAGGSHNGHVTTTSTGSGANENGYQLTSNAAASANHTHSISGDGGTETRVHNVALMYCIKN